MTSEERFGVGEDGFVVKGIDRIIADQQTRARAMFGDDVDLTSGSALRKVLDAAALDTHELWRALESQYYGTFITTAEGPSLDLLGCDLGVPRRELRARGPVFLTIAKPESDRRYALPQGTVIVTVPVADEPVLAFRSARAVILTTEQSTATVEVEAVARGDDGNIPAGSKLRLDPEWARHNLNLGTAEVEAVAQQTFHDGDLGESDAVYRARLLGVPRTVWTQEALLAQVLDVNGVRDAAIFDPLGGVEATRRSFGTFRFGSRAFSRERQTGSPYFFDIVVAAEPGWPWHSGEALVAGVYEEVLDVIRQWRPVSIFPDVLAANQVDVGIRATLVVEAGHDEEAVKGAILDAVRASVNRLRLGHGVLYSDIVLSARTAAGVVDVQNLRLRRFAPAFGQTYYDGGIYGGSQELSVGENLDLAPDEIARFSVDTSMADLQVVVT
ncbi:baseplate J/gp47 family protein [Streptomyces sp. NBC_01235]|uniref:baseplate J/gp47 family protein n=1 Tax=Streptomyces sp. NBC_01235 TaxID=2903788 RepID=UPI002E0DC6C3|nr:baseplate J/gp47 family protein [Streptomyces sp. NBC_01235]